MKKYFLKNKLLGLGIIGFALLSGAGSVRIAYILQNIVDCSVNADSVLFKRMIIISVIYFLVFGVINYVYKLLSSAMITRVIKNMRTDMFGFTLDSDYEILMEQNMGDIISLLSNDTKVIEDDYIKALFMIIGNVITFFITLVPFIYISPVVTVFLLIGVTILGIIPNFAGGSLQKKQIIFSEKMPNFLEVLKII